MTGSEIIADFELYTSDMTELSSTAELALLNKIHQRVCAYRPWEFLKKTASGTLSTSVPYVALPSDFGNFSENNQWTNNAIGIENNASAKVVFIGSGFTPYQIVNFSDRRQYYNQNNIAYLDYANQRLVFTVQPASALSYEFDYIAIPADILASESPIIPTRFQPVIYHGMVADDNIIQLSDKARSYREENLGRYNDYLKDMSYWNSQLLLN